MHVTAVHLLPGAEPSLTHAMVAASELRIYLICMHFASQSVDSKRSWITHVMLFIYVYIFIIRYRDR